MPTLSRIALSRPICGWPSGWKENTKRQMTLAPTNEIAIGRKIRVFATRSSRERSTSTAMARPRPVLTAVPKTSHRTLFRIAVTISGLVKE